MPYIGQPYGKHGSFGFPPGISYPLEELLFGSYVSEFVLRVSVSFLTNTATGSMDKNVICLIRQMREST